MQTLQKKEIEYIWKEKGSDLKAKCNKIEGKNVINMHTFNELVKWH